MSDKSLWVSEKWEDVETRYRVTSVLYEEKTAFQHVMVAESLAYGRMLLLDGIVQTTEKDEFIYHEMMAHVPLLAHPRPETVLIIGGGDGGVLREVLKHPTVKKAVMVEIDAGVVDLSRRYFPTISRGAFADARVELVFDDGAAFVERADGAYDVIIVDSPDPVGPAKVLFAEAFYRHAAGMLTKNGILVRQTGSIHMQPDEQMQANEILRGIFAYIGFYVYTVPTYIGGLFSSVFCSNRIDPGRIDRDRLLTRMRDIPLETEYYNPGIHAGAFSLPEFFEGKLR